MAASITFAVKTDFFDARNSELIDFLAEIGAEFQHKIDQLLHNRVLKKAVLDKIPDKEAIVNYLRENAPKVEENGWKIEELPARLRNRRIDAGDVSPANLDELERYLSCDPNELQGIQVDFDDGHCPSVGNQIESWVNLSKIIDDEKRDLSKCPIMMFRPRALNMDDHLVKIDDKPMNGGLLDFAVITFFNARKMIEQKSPSFYERNGPFFYLSKLENAKEASLWNDIFAWTEDKLNIPSGSFKACILIENIMAAFEMEAMLFAIKDHAIGLNCGMWDYSASILATFGLRPQFVLPDRHQYVNINAQFMKSYYSKVIQTCHDHGAIATGGMAAAIYDERIEQKVMDSKTVEIGLGVDGFLIYDLEFLKALNRLWDDQKASTPVKLLDDSQLLAIPKGQVTVSGLLKNIKVGILFIASWMNGHGTFVLDGNVEDSATAEISRFQVWQWIKLGQPLDSSSLIDFEVVKELAASVLSKYDDPELEVAHDLFLKLVQTDTQFITTWLNNTPEFKQFSLRSCQ